MFTFRNCEVCWEDFFPCTNTQVVCSRKWCRYDLAKKVKVARFKHTADRVVLKSRTHRLRDFKHTGEIKIHIYKEMIKEKWYRYDQHTWKQCASPELHHLILRSECGNHPKKHCKENLILLSPEVHKMFHMNPHMRDKYIIERELRNKFEFIKKERYIKNKVD